MFGELIRCLVDTEPDTGADSPARHPIWDDGLMALADESANEPAHDVLAAEEFGVPAADPELHHRGPIVLPEDPVDPLRPHDILAAEEFPMPAGRPRSPTAALSERRGGWARLGAELSGAFMLGAALARRLARR
jgi:hypothetical protein